MWEWRGSAAAAVCGVEFRVETLALVLGLDLASVALACDELVREHVWLAVPRASEGSDGLELPHSFKHALFRQVLYDRTPPSARMRLHREVGAALEGERAAGVAIPPSELATHFDRGRQPMAALRCYAEAAEAALLNFSPAVCLALTERARTLVPQAPEGAERDALELTLATLQGMSAFHSLGAGAQRSPHSSVPMRCSPELPSIRCARVCCTGSATCRACAATTWRRW